MKTLLLVITTGLMVGGGFNSMANPTARNATKQVMTAPVDPEACKQLMSDIEAGKTRVRELDSKIDNLVITMDAATGSDRMPSMATVIRELVSQRSTMRMMKTKMDDKVMLHMMAHAKSSSMDCPVATNMMTSGY